MKKLFSLLLCCLCLHAMAHNTTLAKLTEVNRCWAEQPDVQPDALPAWQPQSEHEWIRTHLRLVEATLRQRDVRHLSAAQQRHRFQCLDNLHTYWQTGNFPINDQYAFRTPIFIDPYDNFCAVGYLLKASGNEGVSRMIAAKTNLAYVKEMKYPEVGAWAADNGFTVAELAWIQPGYPSSVPCGQVGDGVWGHINELYADNAAGKLYVGGNFSLTEGGIINESIAYVTESGGTYTWHQMGTGVTGEVHAITQYHGAIYAAGHFSVGGTPANVAVWNGTTWTAAGCVDGVVYDLAVAGDVLYAAGDFGACGSGAGRSLARWNGTDWQIIPGITGRVNTLEPVGTGLLLGGAFTVGTATNVARWTPEASFTALAGNLNNEVMDMEYYQDTLYAVCRHTHATDSTSLFMKLRTDGWHFGFAYAENIVGFWRDDAPLSFNTLCGEAGKLNMGGRFFYYPMMGINGHGCFNIGDEGNWLDVDSTVNKMTVFKGQLITAGAFKKGNGGGWSGYTVTLNNIARRAATSSVSQPVYGIAENISLHPNPARTGTQVATTAQWNGAHYRIADATGRTVAEGNVAQATIPLPNVPAGLYIVTVITTAGQKQTTKLSIQ